MMESLVSLEKAKLRLRLTVLSAFLFWAILGIAAWWHVTSITRSPIPALSSFPIAERVSSQLAEGQGGGAAARKAATAAYARWEAAHTKKGLDGNDASSVPFFALLPPLVTGFSLKLVPLCEQALPDATSFFDWLRAKAAALRDSGRVSLPEEPRVYRSLFPGSVESEDSKEGEAKQRPAFVTDLNLLLSPAEPAASGGPGTSTSLLRVVLTDPLPGASCAAPLPNLDRAEFDLTYTVAFSSSARDAKQTDAPADAAEAFASHFVLHADSAITVAAGASDSAALSSFRRKAASSFPALAQLLRLAFFAPLDETSFRFPFFSQQDVYNPFLEPFFSRLGFVFNFLHVQSQVVPHSGIASLLKRPATPSSAWLLDLASQHRLHAVASNWQPEQIITTPTHAPAPTINFAVYRSPVPLVLKDGKPQRHVEADAGEQDRSGARTETVNGIAIPGWGGLVIASPSSAAVPASSVTRFPSDEMRQICGVWVAQLRSFFSLPDTLEDYFGEAAAPRTERAEDRWRVQVVTSRAAKQAILERAPDLENRGTSAADVVMIWTHGEKGETRSDPEKEEKILVVAQHADAGVGLWEVWRLARRVYVQLVERAVSNIRSLQTILEDQTELVVYPHVGEALQRALTFIDCSAEALQGRICSQLPADVREQLLGTQMPFMEGKQDAKGSQRGALRVPHARFLGLALALARAAFQDSLEALQEESVTGKSHFSFEFKCAIYLPVVLPFFLPLLVGFIKVFKQRRLLEKAAAAL
ncbi:putative UBA/TS-N domain-containing protein [Neospora caninum Liverpool]|uniref:Putative UBA/TS-N domain-containing protein n=1 Tax=Neospora caninum (strain Liverpool) TaxID=572307 RepID=F0VI68_NEOCL|nr:putative UBA/TS-N domain-containing protein [Neospora caninum Liverpool]CBZ53429.1 putative UBA/TS-N domain-containing protein [Neospora caninum Liverpool]|eukprot:XP_003883461.1 putative UBA/TS-N domain-containing protein [Neospora caninum Liverpool]